MPVQRYFRTVWLDGAMAGRCRCRLYMLLSLLLLHACTVAPLDVPETKDIYSYAAAPSKLKVKSSSVLSAAAAELIRSRLSIPLSVGGNDGGLSTMDVARLLSETLPVNISDTCTRQSLLMLRNLNADYSLQMLDSIGKPPAGILQGNLNWMGDFDECVNAHTAPSSPIQFSGQYCKLAFPIVTAGLSANLQVGVCVPSGCSGNDTVAFVDMVLQLMERGNGTNFSVVCHPLSKSLDSKAIVAIVILSILGGLLLAATLCDIVISTRSAMLHSCQAVLVDHDAPVCIENSLHEAGERTPLVLKHRTLESPPDDANRSGLGWRLISSFSCYRNGLKLLNTESTESNLACLNGIRYLSICWVVLGHTYVFNVLGAIVDDMALFVNNTLMSRSFQVIFNATVSVDTFFLLSGCLATYLILKELSKRHGSFSAREWIMIYVHRYLRLTAAYAAILMIWTCLVSYISDGPGMPSGSLDSCDKYWWSNLLYVNNLFRPDSTACMDWTWYLANDMQFFMIAPPLAYLLYKRQILGICVTCALVCGSIASSATITALKSYGIGFIALEQSRRNVGLGSWFDDYYIKPWCRFEPYGVGVLLGYILFRYRGRAAINSWIAIIGWLVASGCCLAVLYGPYDAEFGARAATATVAESTAYNSLSRLAWAIGVAWVIFACSTGYGGWVNTFLSWRAFMPLARVTYCTYLIHPVVMILTMSTSRDTVHLDGLLSVPLFLGMLAISTSLAFVASLAFEAPILGLERYMRMKKAASTTH